jgi:copper(I)-binding protein
MKSALAAAVLLAAASPAAVWPAAAAARGIEAREAWSRPAAAGTNGVGYLVLVNHGKADALVGADSPAAEKVEMHASMMSGGVMSMSPETRVALPAGGQVSFAPGARHLMLVGLKRALRVGDHVPATLRFASGETLKVDFTVQTSAPSGGGGAGHMEHMSGMGDMPGMR